MPARLDETRVSLVFDWRVLLSVLSPPEFATPPTAGSVKRSVKRPSSGPSAVIVAQRSAEYKVVPSK